MRVWFVEMGIDEPCDDAAAAYLYFMTSHPTWVHLEGIVGSTARMPRRGGRRGKSHSFRI